MTLSKPVHVLPQTHFFSRYLVLVRHYVKLHHMRPLTTGYYSLSPINDGIYSHKEGDTKNRFDVTLQDFHADYLLCAPKRDKALNVTIACQLFTIHQLNHTNVTITQ